MDKNSGGRNTTKKIVINQRACVNMKKANENSSFCVEHILLKVNRSHSSSSYSEKTDIQVNITPIVNKRDGFNCHS